MQGLSPRSTLQCHSKLACTNQGKLRKEGKGKSGKQGMETERALTKCLLLKSVSRGRTMRGVKRVNLIHFSAVWSNALNMHREIPKLPSFLSLSLSSLSSSWADSFLIPSPLVSSQISSNIHSWLFDKEWQTDEWIRGTTQQLPDSKFFSTAALRSDGKLNISGGRVKKRYWSS